MLRILVAFVALALVACKFPAGFRFGAATAAFQIEGAWLQDGKSPSVWDNLAHIPGYTADGRAPDIAADSYNRYKEDIALMKAAGIKHYRLSISWPRIVPKGRAGEPINAAAIKRYREILVALKEAGITPYVTLYHWDLPAVLAIQGYGIVDRYFVRDFLYYANATFVQLGDLVNYWFTFNEPWCIALLDDIKKRDEGTKPYLIAHNVLLAHAYTVKLYREKYQTLQKGKIGIVLNSDMHYPKDPTKAADVAAAKRAIDFSLGWFADPVFKGDYPAIMRTQAGDRLPKFTAEEKALLKGSTDFFALNHYSSSLETDGQSIKAENYWSDMNVTSSAKPEWKKTDMGWSIVPEGIHDLIVEIHKRYLTGTPLALYVTENGMANYEPTEVEAKADQARIDYMQGYLTNVEKAVNVDKVNVQGYFAWSLIDNFEWRSGFSKRFGMVRIEFTDPPKRIPKASLTWYSNYIKASAGTEAEDQ